jgi:hypothetical protein
MDVTQQAVDIDFGFGRRFQVMPTVFSTRAASIPLSSSLHAEK